MTFTRVRRVRKNKKIRREKMSKHRGRGRGRGRKHGPIPILPLLPVVGVAIEAWQFPGSMQWKLDHLVATTTGYNRQDPHKFRYDMALPFWGSELAAVIAHKVMNRTGVNRAIARATGGYICG